MQCKHLYYRLKIMLPVCFISHVILKRNSKAVTFFNLLPVIAKNTSASQTMLESLVNGHLQDTLIVVFGVRNSLAPIQCICVLCELFVSKQSKNDNLRKADSPFPKLNTVKYGKYNVRYIVPYLGTKISHELQSKTSLSTFKKAVRIIDALH